MDNYTLDNACKGTLVTIINLPNDQMKIQLIRMGISEGDSVLCLERLPGGTVVIQKNRQEIAIGHNLAKKITVLLPGK